MCLSFKYFLCFLFFPPVTLLGGMGSREGKAHYDATVGFCSCECVPVGDREREKMMYVAG